MGRKNKTEIRQNEILEHYYQVIVDEGYENASIAKIARHMGIHPSLIIHYFKTKEDMLIALVKEYFFRLAEEDIVKFKTIDNPDEKFNTFIEGLLNDEKFDNDRYTVGCAIAYLSRRNKKIHDFLFEHRTEMFEFLKNEFSMLMEKKVIKKQDPELLTSFFFALIIGMHDLRAEIGIEQYAKLKPMYRETMLKILM